MEKRSYNGLNATLIHQLKKKLKELRESEEKFKTLFESASDSIFIADTITRKLVDCNHEALRVTGYSKKEILSMRADELHPKDILKETMKGFKKQAQGKIKVVETKLLTKDKQSVPVSISSALIHVGGKDILVGIFRDITEQKKAEEFLKASEEKYRTLLENLPQKIFLKDKNSVYISCNENYARDLKIKPDKIKGKTDFEFYPRQLAEKYRKDDKRLMASGKTEDIEEEYIQDGKTFWVHTIKIPVRGTKGNVISLLGIFWDITKEKKAEEALRQSQGKLNAMLNSIGEHMSMMDKDLNILWANDIAKKIFGKDIVGKKCYTVYHKRKKPCEPYPCLSLKAFKDGKTHEHDTQVIGKDGNPIYFHCTANVALRDKKGKPTAVLEISRNVTQQKEMEKKIKESEQKWSSLAENAPNVMIITDEKGVIQFINRTVAGFSKKKTIGKKLYDFIAPKYRTQVKKVVSRVFRTGRGSSYEIVGKGAHGKDAWYRTYVGPIKVGGKITALSHITADITELKQMKKQISGFKKKLKKKRR
jgi:PAS domain S-box-containing protein